MHICGYFSYSECQEGINFGRCCLKKSMKAEKVHVAIFGI